MAVMRIYRYQCGLRLLDTIVLGIKRQVVLHCLLGIPLQVKINSGVNLQTVHINGVRTEAGVSDKLLQHKINEVGSFLFLSALYISELYRRVLCFIDLCPAVHALLFRSAEFLHGIENHHHSLMGRPAVSFTIEGRIVIRALGNACQHCTLIEAQLTGMLAEIGESRRFYAVGTLSEINLVQIHLKDFILGILSFQLECQENFLNLSLQRTLLRQIRILGQLLRDGGAALTDRAAQHIRYGSAENAPGVNTEMLIKAMVLNADKGVLQFLGNISQLHRHAVFLGVYAGNLPALHIVYV